MSSRSTSDGTRRKAIDGRPFTCSKATKTFFPALKLGCPHDEASLVAGYARHSARNLSSVAVAFFAIRYFFVIFVAQNVAIGLSGDPVPPGIGSGAAVSRNSHRLRDAAA